MKLAIERSSTETIHQLFQYEVMKLLHGIITFPGLENVRNSGHDFDSENVRFKSNVINNKNELIDN